MSDPFNSFSPGFVGVLGSGAGKHSSASTSVINYQTINRLELSIQQLYSLVRSNGNYGSFLLETLQDGYTTETFDGDGATTTFSISRTIPREFVSGWDINLHDPFASGILPTGYGGELSGFNTSNNLASSFAFSTAPPVGTDNVKIHYKYVENWGSSIAGSAYLSDYVIT
jgi:hypothetical protein